MTDPDKDPDNANAAGDASDSADLDWAAALAEQAAASRPNQAEGLASSAEDDWAAALAEQTAATQVAAPAPAPAPAAPAAPSNNLEQRTSTASPATNVFQPLVNDAIAGNADIDMVMDIPVQLSVELGRTRLTIKNILQLGQGSVVELDGLAGEPMDIYVNGYLIAQGEVVVVDDKYGIRVTDIITPADRIHRLNGRR
ncbi:MAG: flagellar motor switch protein FliN [Alcaligenaceae bacterium]|nr:flagellar motor switch protein FliN [Alcaligenaceae bacterium]